MRVSAVLGCGRFLPPRVVTSEALAGELGIAGAAMTEMSGVRQRHYAEPAPARRTSDGKRRSPRSAPPGSGRATST